MKKFFYLRITLLLIVLMFVVFVVSCDKVKKEELFTDHAETSPVAAVINRAKLEGSGLPVPYSYHDLLSPVFSGNIAIPNPKTTVIGYKILLHLINTLGEDEAFEYFDNLAKNNIRFTEFDSEPLFDLTSGKTAIGFGFISAVVNAVKLTDAPLEICFFEEDLSDSETDNDFDRKKLLLEKWKY